MNNSVVFNILIVSFHLSIFVSLTTSLGPGISGCIYLGETEADGKKCRKDAVKLKKLPKECSSIIYDITDYFLGKNTLEPPFDIMESLVRHQSAEKPLYFIYSYGSSDDWKDIMSNPDLLDRVRSIKSFIEWYPAKGMIISQLDEPYYNKTNDFYVIFRSYVNAIKQHVDGLEIGLRLSARTFIEKGNVTNLNSTGVPWFDFSKLNDCVDFYVIEFSSFNECPIDEIYSGITPVESSNSKVMTLKKFEVALNLSTIARQKILFEFLISPTMAIPVMNSYPPCERSYGEYCENVDSLRKIWCHDNSEILYAKGAFSKKYAQGFLGRHIDLVDRDDKCNCEKYITFIMMVNGFKTMRDPRTCLSFL